MKSINFAGFALFAILFVGCQDKGKSVATVAAVNNKEKRADNREIEQKKEQQKQILNQEEKRALVEQPCEAENFHSAANIDEPTIEISFEKKDKKPEDTQENEFKKNKEKITQSYPPVLRFAKEPDNRVPVWIWINKKKNNSSIVLHIKDKNTGRNFLYAVKDLKASKSHTGKFLFLVPGEYSYRAGTGIFRNNNLHARAQRIRGPLVPMSFPRYFKVEKEPIAEIDGEKVHAVLNY